MIDIGELRVKDIKTSGLDSLDLSFSGRFCFVCLYLFCWVFKKKFAEKLKFEAATNSDHSIYFCSGAMVVF